MGIGTVVEYRFCLKFPFFGKFLPNLFHRYIYIALKYFEKIFSKYENLKSKEYSTTAP
jgi:hypothetical protein